MYNKLANNNNKTFDFFTLSKILFDFEYYICENFFSFNNKLYLYIKKTYSYIKKLEKLDVLFITIDMQKTSIIRLIVESSFDINILT